MFLPKKSRSDSAVRCRLNNKRKHNTINESLSKDIIEELMQKLKVKKIKNNKSFLRSLLDNGDDDPVPFIGPAMGAFFAKDEPVDLVYAELIIPQEGDKEYVNYSPIDTMWGNRAVFGTLQHSVDKVINDIPFVHNGRVFVNSDEEYPEEKVEVTYKSENAYVDEDELGLAFEDPLPWKPGVRYGVAGRVINDEKLTKAYLSLHMYSFEDKEWLHYGTLQVPYHDQKIVGDFVLSYLQRLDGDDIGYSCAIGQYYRINANGEWQTPESFTVTALSSKQEYWNAEQADNGDIKLMAGGHFDNSDRSKTFINKDQPAKPSVLKTVEIKNLQATHKDDVINVKFEHEKSTGPPMTYKLTVANEKGEVVFNSGLIIYTPDKEKIEVPMKLQQGKYNVEIKIKDIFNQENEYKVEMQV